MKWRLFLDDQRSPITPDDWVVARSSDEAIDLTKKHGVPVHMALDHDLGEQDTSFKYIWWVIDLVVEDKLSIPPNFTYSIHSQNPVGAENLRCLLEGFLADQGLR